MRNWLVALTLLFPAVASSQSNMSPQQPMGPISITGFSSADYTPPVWHMTGNIRFCQGQKYLTAQEIFYNTSDNSGKLSNASVTTCCKENPDYKITASCIELTPDQKLKLRHVKLYLGNRRIFTLPNLRLNASGQTDKQQFLPRPGYNKHDGLFVAAEYAAVNTDKTSVNLLLKPTTRSGVQGGVEGGYALRGSILELPAYIPESDISLRRYSLVEPHYSPEGCVFPQSPPQPPVLAVFGTFYVKERIYNVNEPNLLVTRLPEIGLHYVTPQRCIEGDGMPKLGLQTQARASWGRFKESPGDGYIGRTDIRGTASTTLATIGDSTAIRGSGLARYSNYDTGDNYTVFGGAIDVSRLFPTGSYASLRLIGNATIGNTPLLFDEVDIKNELQGAGQYVKGKHTYGLLVRYDIDRNEIRQWEFSVARRLHCLEPKITWRSDIDQISFGIRILGI